MLHFVSLKNLPYSTEEVKKVCSSCRICAELKPHFHRPQIGTLIKSTQPMERLNIDFKGPLPSATQNKYFLTIIDEYSRFPFVFPCPNILLQTVIKCLNQLFSLCGTPGYIHSDRGSSFISREIKEYLSQKGIATSRSTLYHPTGNAQCERYNGIVWKSVRLALKTHSFPIYTGKWYFQTHYTLLDRSSQYQSTQLHMRVFSVGHHVEPHFRHGCLHRVL